MNDEVAKQWRDKERGSTYIGKGGGLSNEKKKKKRKKLGKLELTWMCGECHGLGHKTT